MLLSVIQSHLFPTLDSQLQIWSVKLLWWSIWFSILWGGKLSVYHFYSSISNLFTVQDGGQHWLPREYDFVRYLNKLSDIWSD